MVRKAASKDESDSPESLAPGYLPKTGSELDKALLTFKLAQRLTSKGKIATMIFASRLARTRGLPIDTDNNLRTDGEGQIKGLGKSAVQKILSDYSISQILAEEAGRTSRGSLGNIRVFLEFLNAQNLSCPVDPAEVEAWWIEQAKGFFNAKPFSLRYEHGTALRVVIRDLLTQARRREEDSGGTMFVGAMLQHLVGAKLSLALPQETFSHNGFSVADAVSGRSGDFEIGEASIHVTTAPGESVIRKCSANIQSGRHPIIVTVAEMVNTADVFARQLGIHEKLDILDAEQFIVSNLHELGGFKTENRRITITALVDRYNQIILANETDLSLSIR